MTAEHVQEGDHVARIIELEKEADDIETTEVDPRRWEAARLMVAELDGAKSQRRLAHDIGKSQSHVKLCAAAWREYLGTRPEERPPWNVAYQEAKRARTATPSNPPADSGTSGASEADPIPRTGGCKVPTYTSYARSIPTGAVPADVRTEVTALKDALVHIGDESSGVDAATAYARAVDALGELVGRLTDPDGGIDVRDVFDNPKAKHGLRMLAPYSDADDAPMRRLVSALTDIGMGENPDRSYLHACQAVTDLAAH